MWECFYREFIFLIIAIPLWCQIHREQMERTDFSGRFSGGKYYEGAGDVLSFFPTSIIEWFLGTGTKSVQEAFPWEPRKQLMWAGHHGDVNPISSRHLPYVVLRVVWPCWSIWENDFVESGDSTSKGGRGEHTMRPVIPETCRQGPGFSNPL